MITLPYPLMVWRRPGWLVVEEGYGSSQSSSLARVKASAFTLRTLAASIKTKWFFWSCCRVVGSRCGQRRRGGWRRQLEGQNLKCYEASHGLVHRVLAGF
eukprot:GHVS01001626.1.p1 GENE.GHVS01001626.1~~GHVS01001626.1.p1  ORF type:complete len:100 (-),score=15.79 GHVS01001626.1:289-588(-)